MIKVEKDFDDVPKILKNKNREEAFNKNIKDKVFNHGKTLYKPDDVKERLKSIYNTKCVYCEDTLLNAPKHIEHYRPKNIYYWLAYSWDNLFLCCTSCNSSKGVTFDVINSRVNYRNEVFENIHGLANAYDELEKPMLINPEKEDVLEYLIFDRDAKILSNNKRVDYTIGTCKLNRGELRQLREEIVEDFVLLIRDYHFLFDEKNQQDNKEILKTLIPIIKQYINKCTKESKFYALRYFILNNLDVFIDNQSMRNIIKYLVSKLML